MKALFTSLALAASLLGASPALAAAPSPSPAPQSLPIRGVTVELQQMKDAPNNTEGASHVEMPPFAMPRQMRLNAAPAAANEMAAPPAPRPAAARAKAAPAPSPSSSPTSR